jgi:hypothetical protein
MPIDFSRRIPRSSTSGRAGCSPSPSGHLSALSGQAPRHRGHSRPRTGCPAVTPSDRTALDMPARPVVRRARARRILPGVRTRPAWRTGGRSASPIGAEHRPRRHRSRPRRSRSDGSSHGLSAGPGGAAGMGRGWKGRTAPRATARRVRGAVAGVGPRPRRAIRRRERTRPDPPRSPSLDRRGPGPAGLPTTARPATSGRSPTHSPEPSGPQLRRSLALRVSRSSRLSALASLGPSVSRS